ncbi:MAG: CIA30 family protein, partial [Fibrobacter sp.]|nr:CIA30 family protein [Fibrobacter sp.]
SFYLKKGAYKYAPYVAIGLNLKRDTTEIDLSACKSISYKFKGASHNFRVETSPVKNWNFHHVNKDASADWKEVELTWDQFTQESWGDDDKHFSLDKGMDKVQRFAWEVKGALDVPDGKNQPAYSFLYVDDVRCNGVSITAISGKTDTPKSSSATAQSSSSVANSSSATVPASSASVVVSYKDLLLIDDVEDGDEVLKTGGTWYAYTDSASGGKSKISNVYDPALPGYVVVFPGTKDATNGTQGFVGLTDIVWNQADYAYAPFVALGLNMNDTTKGYDLSACSALSYRYKGASHKFKIQDGQVLDYAYHELLSTDATEWTTVVIPWEKLEQPVWTQDPKDLNKAAIKKMAWEVVGYADFDAQPEINYLYVDDLKCLSGSVGIKTIARAASGIKLGFQGNMLNVNFNKAGKASVQVFDMMGHVVESFNENVTAGVNQFSLKNMSTGNYVVRVMMNGASKTARISIK